MYPKETNKVIEDFSKKYGYNDIFEKLNYLKNLKVLIIGDGIIDEYHYCESIGKAAKAPVMVNKYLSHEVFAGGAFAIANHVAGICDKVHLVTLLGKDNSREDFILNNLKPNIATQFFYRDDGPTIVKKRYIEEYRYHKLFELNYLSDFYIDKKCEVEIIDYLKSELHNYDLVLVPDFGHGFITENIIKVLEKFSKKIAVNTQTNAANIGYNMITRYKNPDYVCLDESEARWATQERAADIEDVINKLSKTLNTHHLIITLGKNGSIGINDKNEMNRTPIFSKKVVDTIGAGDAFFAFTAPCFAQGLALDFVSFIGNTVGALAVQIMGNKKPVEKHELLEFINTLLNV